MGRFALPSDLSFNTAKVREAIEALRREQG